MIFAFLIGGACIFAGLASQIIVGDQAALIKGSDVAAKTRLEKLPEDLLALLFGGCFVAIGFWIKDRYED